jgi:hypothetical protein
MMTKLPPMNMIHGVFEGSTAFIVGLFYAASGSSRTLQM